MTLTEYIEKQIVTLFDNVVKRVGSGEVVLDDYSDDEWIAIATAIGISRRHTLQCWREFANKEE